MSRLKSYLTDPLLDRMYAMIRAAGPVRPISLDITSKCNLRCTGCYYFAEGMDKVETPADESAFEALIERELGRGTNFVTVVGGEPALVPERLRRLHQNFRINVATNGLIRIPFDGMEDMPLGIAVWGDVDTDSKLRDNGRRDLFSIALGNYRNDPRAFFYYTVAPGRAEEIEHVVETCIENGNRLLFNYYSDVSRLGGDLDFRHGFDAVRAEIDRMISLHPEWIYTTRYLNEVITTGRIGDLSWGYDVCTNLSIDYPDNDDRRENGMPYNPHFNAINADFDSARRCCTATTRDCDSCFDTWEHYSWIMINMRRHLGSADAFRGWLGAMFSFYVINRLVDYETGTELLDAFQASDAPRVQGERPVPAQVAYR